MKLPQSLFVDHQRWSPRATLERSFEIAEGDLLERSPRLTHPPEAYSLADLGNAL